MPLDAISPVFFDRSSFLAPDERAGKAYALLAQTMARSGKAGIGSFVMRGHEYLVAIVAANGILRGEVLRYVDEVRTPQSIGLAKPAKAEAGRVRAFGKEIDALSKPALNAAEMADLEAEALHELAAKKASSGEGVIATENLEDDDDEAGGSAQVIDLMDVLRKSLGAKAGGAAAAARKTAAKKASAGTTAAKTAAKKTAPKRGRATKTASPSRRSPHSRSSSARGG